MLPQVRGKSSALPGRSTTRLSPRPAQWAAGEAIVCVGSTGMLLPEALLENRLSPDDAVGYTGQNDAYVSHGSPFAIIEELNVFRVRQFRETLKPDRLLGTGV